MEPLVTVDGSTFFCAILETEVDEDATIFFDELDSGFTREEDLSFDNPSPQAIRKHAAHRNAQKEILFILKNIINNIKNIINNMQKNSAKKCGAFKIQFFAQAQNSRIQFFLRGE